MQNKLRVDWMMLMSVIPICLFGIFTMSNFTLTNGYLLKQSAWLAIGVIIFIIISNLELDFIKDSKVVLVFYAITNVLLVATLVLGKFVNGSKAWISLGGFSLQPADFAKISLVILLAKYFSKRHIEIRNLRHIIVSFLYAALPAALVFLQPDLGSTLVLLGIWFTMVLVSGLSKKHFFALLMFSISLIIFMWVSIFTNIQKARILNFVDPLRDVRGSGYNVYQSQIAIGSGGALGKGVGYGTQSRLNFLPEHETDFIFSAYAEEWGFVGVLLLYICISIYVFRIIYISSLAQDNFKSLISLGVLAWLSIHIAVNIGMNLGLLPVTGIPLPFMSYGGSHILAEFIGIGMVASFVVSSKKARRNYKSEFVGLE